MAHEPTYPEDGEPGGLPLTEAERLRFIEEAKNDHEPLIETPAGF